jgi:hypothetical protein
MGRSRSEGIRSHGYVPKGIIDIDTSEHRFTLDGSTGLTSEDGALKNIVVSGGET